MYYPLCHVLGVVDSWGWLGVSLEKLVSTLVFWSFEGVAIAHIVLSGLLFLASVWHWVYWDLELFVDTRTGKPRFGTYLKCLVFHLLLSGILCFGFGAFHLTGTMGTWNVGFRWLWSDGSRSRSCARMGTCWI